MEHHVNEKVKRERSELIRQISESGRLSYMDSMRNKAQRVLVEKVDTRGMARGYGEHYLPVKFPTTDPTRNRFERVILLEPDARSGSPVMLASPAK